MNITNSTVEQAKELLREAGYFVDALWQIVDIMHRAEEEFDIDINKQQAMKVFENLSVLATPERGINWESIEEAIGAYITFYKANFLEIAKTEYHMEESEFSEDEIKDGISNGWTERELMEHFEEERKLTPVEQIAS
ncbi:MAG: hypothetical protein AAF391_07145 [Bacteroidota bacterium]